MTSSSDKDNSCSYSSLYRRAQKRTRHDMIELGKANVNDIAACNDNTDNVDVTLSEEDTPAESIDYMSVEDVLDETDGLAELCKVAGDDDDDDDYSDWMDSDDDEPLSDSNSSSSGLSDNGIDADVLSNQLASWSLEFNVTHAGVKKLLQIFRPYVPSLPRDPRTILHTPRQVAVTKCGTGEYMHCGLKKKLTSLLSECTITDGQEIKLQFNIDGLPLFKSSNTQLWPILCLVKQPEFVKPFVVGIYSGNVKPPVSFLGAFVNELNEIIEEGLTVDTKHLHVVVDNFVCDAPARAFVKCIKMHSGYSSCEKCDQHGEWDKKVIFECEQGNLRTDEQFKCRTDEDHHLRDKISPLTALPVGMVSQFPLDPMHLLYLGVTRKLILAWIRGPPAVRLPARTVTDLSAHLLILGPYVPSEFCRRPRSLSDIDRWKATEFRLFLLYCSAVVLRFIVSEKVHKHFLLLFVAATILSSSQLCKKFVSYADGLMKAFVKGVAEIYGKNYVVYNIHGLLHIAGDAERFGCLENFSSFCFENKLKEIKREVSEWPV